MQSYITTTFAVAGFEHEIRGHLTFEHGRGFDVNDIVVVGPRKARPIAARLESDARDALISEARRHG